MVIDAAGKVGIGTDNPDKILSVSDQDGSVLKVSASTFEVNQTVTSWSQTDHDENPIIRWNFKSGVDDHLFFASGGNASVGTQMAMVISEGHGFKVGRNGFDGTDTDVDADNEFFRITNSGDVGIGTNNPNKLLHVHNSSSNAVAARFTSSNSSLTGGLLVGWNGTFGQAYLVENADYRIGTNNTERLRITSDGDITTLGSITTQTSNAFYENNRRVLEVNGDSTQGWLAVGASRTDTDAYVGGINFINRHGQIDNHRFLGYIRLKSTHVNTGQYGTNVLKGQLEFATKSSSATISTTTPDMVISPGGDVGIGTDDPSTKLEIAGTGSPTFRISDLDGTN